MSDALRAIYVIWQREIIKFWREKARIVTSLVQPAVWLFIMGKGIGSTFRGPMNVDYVQFMFPGVIAMTVLFSASFSAISIVWDREFGFLKEVLVAPVPRTAVVIGKALAGSTTATLQGVMVLLFAPLIGVNLQAPVIIKTILLLLFISFTVTSGGIVIAAKMQSFHSFQLVMNFLIMPMFFLSGAMFPIHNLPLWMKLMARIDPMAYGVDALKGVLIGANEMGIGQDIVVLAVFCMLAICIAVFLFNKEG
ncbi:ABC transporter permease [Thermincola potens]|uniref:Transport permease protein n=1 Tax=Thermincola potens (strain JR) TaxID=635013 RepID=D5X873_THEPJ|nr:ABC transporter permease [Thermincola potens]ADG82793.1 daunorubicin resistance ABC transporter, inner membrane subunit B [Thermincola potens JR]